MNAATNSRLNYSFSPIPNFLFDPKYASLPANAKLLYSLFLNRLSLSKKNKDRFSDIDGVYIIYTREQMAMKLNSSRQTASKMVRLLVLFGLIKERRIGLNHTNRIYINEFFNKPKSKLDKVKNTVPESTLTVPQISNDPDVKYNTHQDVKVVNTSKTDLKKDILELAAPSITQQSTYVDSSSEVSNGNGKNNKDTIEPLSRKISSGTNIKDAVLKQIDFAKIKNNYPQQSNSVLVMAEIMIQVYSSRSDRKIKLSGSLYRPSEIQKRFDLINYDIIAYILDCLRNSTSTVMNIKAYLLASLYNAPLTFDFSKSKGSNIAPKKSKPNNINHETSRNYADLDLSDVIDELS